MRCLPHCPSEKRISTGTRLACQVVEVRALLSIFGTTLSNIAKHLDGHVSFHQSTSRLVLSVGTLT